MRHNPGLRAMRISPTDTAIAPAIATDAAGAASEKRQAAAVIIGRQVYQEVPAIRFAHHGADAIRRARPRRPLSVAAVANPSSRSGLGLVMVEETALCPA